RRVVRPVRVTGRDRSSMVRALRQGPGIVVVEPTRPGGEHRKPSSRRRLRVDVLVPVLLFLFAAAQTLGAVDDTSFHPDESRWLNRAHFVRDLADPFGPTWEDYYTTRGQPPMGSYLMGIGLLLQGQDLDTNKIWDFAYDSDWNAFNGAMPTDEDLAAGRRTNAVVGALVVVVVYFVASRLSNRVGGLIAGIFLSLHPLHIHLGSQALSDQLLALLLALAFLCAFRFGRNPTWGAAVLLGVLLGLGGATKLSPLLLSVPIAGYGAILLGHEFWRHRRSFPRSPAAKSAIMLLLQPLIAFAAFVLASPYLWQDPIRRTYYLFEFRRVEMVGQSNTWPSVAVANPAAALSRIGERLNEDYSTTEHVQRWFGELMGIDTGIVGFDLLLAAIGGLLLVPIVFKRGLRSPHAITAGLMLSELAAVVLGMGSDFYRYYLPVVLIMVILIGVFAGELWKAIRSFPRPGRQRTRTRPGLAPATALALDQDQQGYPESRGQLAS
ncbi:MAG TPA: phospholipid carrier-dependent glycosyltransferase, partial [Thermomicrobiales bacterium]|nr:phospholipid carrier-dependent glycosyltransferase [Thermomicrobiales bacterium]